MTGLSFRKYVESLRIQRGKVELLIDNRSITDISGESGFEFSNNFSSSFKKHTGLNPKQYKETSSHAYRFLRHFVTQKGALYHHNGSESTTNILEVDLSYPEKYEIVILFVGLFPEPVPNQVPVVGVATTQTNDIRLRNIPDGVYYLLACEVDPHITFFRAFAMVDNLRAKADAALCFAGDQAHRVRLDLRPPRPEDPAITVNLPTLLMDLMKKKSSQHR